MFWPFSLFKNKSLDERVRETKKIKIDGVLFEIKRISPINYLDGAKTMLQIYDTYSKNTKVGDAQSAKKIQEHYRDIIMAAVISPELSRKKDDGDKVFVDEIFTFPGMSDLLYQEILTFTYGKKKLKKLMSQGKN